MQGIQGTSCSLIAFAQFSQIGTQPLAILAGNAFAFSTTIFSVGSIIASTSSYPGGTIFTLPNIGYYEISYQMSYPVIGGVVIYVGVTSTSLSALAYTTNNAIVNGQLSASVLIKTTTINSFLSINSIGAIPLTTTPTSGDVVSIKQIG